MTLYSRHMIWNSCPGGLRPSTLPLGHGGSPKYWLSHVDEDETFVVSFKPPRPGKWNESGFRPPLCTYRLNWARRTSWGWWDDWDDTVLQTQDSKFEPWRSEAEHATSRSRRLPTILTFTRGWGRNNFVSFKPPRPGTEPRTLAWKAAVLTTTLGPPPSTWDRPWVFGQLAMIRAPCLQSKPNPSQRGDQVGVIWAQTRWHLVWCYLYPPFNIWDCRAVRKYCHLFSASHQTWDIHQRRVNVWT